MASAGSRFAAAVSGERRSVDDERRAARHAESFDPYASVETAATGAFDSFRDRLNRTLTDIRGQQVGMGRLNTGFATHDEDRLVERGVQDLNQELMRNSMNAASMDLQNRQFGAGLAHQRTGRFYDLLAGQRDYETAERNARRERRGSLVSGIGSVLGGIGGAVLGGPAGAAAGSRIGGSLGSIFG